MFRDGVSVTNLATDLAIDLVSIKISVSVKCSEKSSHFWADVCDCPTLDKALWLTS